MAVSIKDLNAATLAMMPMVTAKFFNQSPLLDHMMGAQMTDEQIAYWSAFIGKRMKIRYLTPDGQWQGIVEITEVEPNLVNMVRRNVSRPYRKRVAVPPHMIKEHTLLED